jgi:UDP-N-acetyl-D-galactosamine dehydrogenase
MAFSEKIGVIGLGYVGLPVALAFAKKYPGAIGFDISKERIAELTKAIDRTKETPAEELKNSKLKFSSNLDDLKGVTLFVVCVPTPVDRNNRPDLYPLVSASETVGKVIGKGAIVVYESTVYPGVTEDICGPIIERISGLKRGVDFKLGYSPERINPGDREHALEKVIKVVSGEDAESLERIAAAYAGIVDAGVYKAKSIKVAEAAKVIENTQRDLNIAFMNELSIIFDKLGIRTKDVLEAAGTKWNFLRFSPGLVGGHCIGVDPYYLTMKAEEVGYHPQVILSGRRINDGMGKFIAEKAIKLRVASGENLKDARAGILGLTFKENVPDIRNSRVPDIIRELKEFGVKTLVHDPHALGDEAQHEYGIKLSDIQDFRDLDILIVAVSHREFLDIPPHQFAKMLRPGGVLVDVKSVIDPSDLPKGTIFWSL